MASLVRMPEARRRVLRRVLGKGVFSGCLPLQTQRRSSREIRFTRVASAAGRFLQHSGRGSCAASRGRTAKPAGAAEGVRRAVVWRPQQWAGPVGGNRSHAGQHSAGV